MAATKESGKLFPDENLPMKTSGDSETESDSMDMDSDTSGDRHTWGKKAEYFLSVIGFCVGLGNIWRFPYVCMRNGGGAFLIPFLLALVICAFPVYFLEVALGQFIGKGPLHAWDMCPLFKGIGLSMNMICLLVSWYYSMILGWCLIYMVNSFRATLPWTQCGQWWNTDRCMTPQGLDALLNATSNATANFTEATTPLAPFTSLVLAANLTSSGVPGNGGSTDPLFSNGSYGGGQGGGPTTVAAGTAVVAENLSRVLSTDEFWHHNVLELSADMGHLGGIPWHTALSLLVSNAVVMIAIIRGIHSSGKVVYVTATLPYLLLSVILIMGCTLPGAGDGILFYIKPDFNKLLLIQTWVEAAIQVFYSLGPAWGCLITMASYNKFDNNCFRDAIILTFICEGTSVFGGFAIFSVLGHMAHVLQVPIMEFAKSGAGLAFIVYPEAISYLPLPQLWGVMFFLMLFTVGLDSQFANMETLITSIADAWPEFTRKWRTLITTSVVTFITAAALLFTARGGGYWFQLVDWYIAAFSLLIQSALECVVVAWIYGADRFSYDIQLMVGKKPPFFIIIAWKFICPILLMILFFITLAFYKPPTFAGYDYPLYSVVIGWLIATLPFFTVVIKSVVMLFKAHGSFIQRVKSTCRPSPDWGPSNAKARAQYLYSKADLDSDDITEGQGWNLNPPNDQQV